VPPGTKRDSQYPLDLIVDNPTALEPKELTASFEWPAPPTHRSATASAVIRARESHRHHDHAPLDHR